jgi:L-seryl-tRNA(Ser) seleniumtransferase
VNVYERLGVRTLINARGGQTLIGGSIVAQEVLDAMSEAAPYFVDVSELNQQVGEIIARITGAEAGYVTAGAVDGILLATAGLMTGKDPAKIQQLPDSAGMKNQVIVHRSQRHWYDQAVIAAGAKFVEIGNAWSTAPWELEAAINEKTAGVFFTVSPLHRKGFLSLPEVICIAHNRNVPVYLDAASMLPPASNLQSFVSMGADLVIFSGGKGLMGPQSTGILCGRKELVEAAALNGSPYPSIGRSSKVSKEEMIGLLTALELYVQRDHVADQARWRRQTEYIARAVSDLGLSGIEAVVVHDEFEDQLPETHITIREALLGLSARQLEEEMYNGDPRIAMGVSFLPHKSIIVPHMLREGEEVVVARRLIEIVENTRA